MRNDWRDIPARWKYPPEIAGGVCLCFYVLMKYKSVALTLKGYGVNPHLFLLLDAGTIPSYVWCSGRLIRHLCHHTFNASTLCWTAGSLISFLLPYAYLFSAGKSRFSLPILIALGAFLSLSLVFSICRLGAKIRKAKGMDNS